MKMIKTEGGYKSVIQLEDLFTLTIFLIYGIYIVVTILTLMGVITK